MRPIQDLTEGQEEGWTLETEALTFQYKEPALTSTVRLREGSQPRQLQPEEVGMVVRGGAI
jgi:hypothetical protein